MSLMRSAFTLALALGFMSPAAADTRVALVIGNSVYRHVPALPNTSNDAGDMVAALERLGFSVRRVNDGGYDDMRRALLEFSRSSRDSDMAIVFFAGHGIELGGENWLIPVDAALKFDQDTEHEAISLKNVVLTVSAAAKLGLVVLDACRDNPFAARMQRSVRTRAVERGLARIEPPRSVLVAFAARDGTIASDGAGRNSPFTTALLHHIETPGLEINFLFRNVRDDVIEATSGQQEPFVYGSLSKDPIFLKSSAPATLSPTPSPAVAAPDEAAWARLKDTDDSASLARFIEQFPRSRLRREAEARIKALAALPKRDPPPGAPDPKTSAKPKCFAFLGRQYCE